MPQTTLVAAKDIGIASFQGVLKGGVPASAMCPAHCAKVAPSIWHLETRRRSSLKNLMTIQLCREPLSNKILKCSCNFVELHHVQFQRTTRSHLKAHQQEATPTQLMQHSENCMASMWSMLWSHRQDQPCSPHSSRIHSGNPHTDGSWKDEEPSRLKDSVNWSTWTLCDLSHPPLRPTKTILYL